MNEGEKNLFIGIAIIVGVFFGPIFLFLFISLCFFPHTYIRLLRVCFSKKISGPECSIRFCRFWAVSDTIVLLSLFATLYYGEKLYGDEIKDFIFWDLHYVVISIFPRVALLFFVSLLFSFLTFTYLMVKEDLSNIKLVKKIKKKKSLFSI